MSRSPQALVVSDYPILGNTAATALQKRYSVTRQSWKVFCDAAPCTADLIVVDVTAMDRETALRLVSSVVPTARILVCSLNWNEVEVCTLSNEGVEHERDFPSLFAFVA